jgi:TonB family protein
MRVRFSLSLLLVFVIRSSGATDRVVAKDGRIVAQGSSGQTTVLTQTGLDSDPWLSPDGRTLVFLRHLAADVFRTSVYKIDMRTRTLSLLYGGPVKYRGRESSYFGRPELDEPQETLFLLLKDYSTEGSLIAIRVANGRTKLISDHVVGYDVVECAKDRGDLVALKRHQNILGAPYFLYWLYSPSGDEMGLAGAEELNVETLRDRDCQAPQLFSPVPSRTVGPLLGDTIRVDGSVMEQQLVTRVEPTYPSQAQSEHIQGDVRLQVRVAADGTVQDANLVSGPPQLFAAAIAAVKQWRYRPMVSSGHFVPVVTTVNIPFRLPSTAK